MREAVRLRNSQSLRVFLEASGGVSLATVRDIAATGIDRISVGELTHSAAALPSVRLADAPPFRQPIFLTRGQINEAVQRISPNLVATNWSGAERVRVARRSRPLEEAEIKQLLTAVLQRDQVRDKGELELRLMRPWTTVAIPDEPVVLNILDFPVTGIAPNLYLRFELRHGQESLGSWQLSLQARVWREVWVARSALKRGQALNESEVTREKRDVLTLRDMLNATSSSISSLELTDNVQEGAPLAARSVRSRPLIRRGELVEAFVQDGALSVSFRVEVLEDGAPGQMVRVRNTQSRRELRGKVQNEQTILIAL
jgi:flagella basal body P-ring formation protein FlgA